MHEGRALRIAQVVAAGLVVALFGLLLWKVSQSEGGAASALERGESPMAPDFTLERLDGSGTLSLASLRGKAVVVNFWASWCIPCKEEAPLLEETWRKHRDAGLVVVGIDSEDFRADAKRFVERYDVTYPVVYDGKKSQVGRWGVNGYPETFCVDRQGRLVGERISGGVDADYNREKFDECLTLALGSEAPGSEG